MSVKEFFDAWVEFENDPQAQMDFAAQAIHLLTDKEFTQVLRMIDDHRKDQLSKDYQYLITFTIDPTKHPEVGQDLEERIVEYIKTIPIRTALKPKECVYVRELHKNGRPHYHVKLITKKALRSDAFSPYEKSIGKVDISRSKHTNSSAHIDFYLNKENTSIKLL